MCGIYCYVGKKKAIPVLLDGLASLEYRGYDSAGIAYVTDKINIIKEKGRLDNLKKLLDLNTDTYLGIGHTRWATHGKPNKKNAHPHHQGKVTLVHNGIIENYQELKSLLKEYKFKSETDTEVLCCLIDKLLKENNNILKVLSKLNELVKGSYALGIILNDDLNNIYGIKKNSPLILAKSDIGNFLASDIPAILKYTNEYILLDDNNIVKMSKDEVKIYDSKLNVLDKKINTFDGDINKISKGKYEHFLLKEIYEQPDVLYKTYLENQNLPDLKKYNKIHIVGCGSAYHAGLVGKYYIEKYCNIEVNVEIASEYRYKNNFINKNTLVIFISQSGETADTLACVKKVKDKCDTLGIINVIDSSIAREVKNVIYTKAGCEIAVATTKAYSCQILVLMMMALKKDITNLISKINNLLKNDYEEIAKKIYKSEHLFYIGRDIAHYTQNDRRDKTRQYKRRYNAAYPHGQRSHKRTVHSSGGGRTEYCYKR